ncbi:MAG: flagellin, partial [Oscillospiraceae bacterium]
MIIQHNNMATNSYNRLSGNNALVSKNLEKLSSGYKINRAGDDAAGLAISEKMRAQITGLTRATQNAQDGVSLVQTAEGNLTEVHSMLNRMVDLATQSSNGTIDDNVDRKNLQKEVQSLKDEIN